MRLRTLLAAVLLLFAAIGAATAQAWPPTPDPGDLPYGDPNTPYGLLHKNGHTYKIEYVTTLNTASDTDSAAPVDFTLSATGFATRAFVNVFDVVYNALGSDYLNGNLLYRVWLDKRMPWDVGPIVSTDAGAYSHTLRTLLLSLDYRYGSRNASGSSTPNPFYKFRVTALDPVSNYFSLQIEVAQGGYNHAYGYFQSLYGYPYTRSIVEQSSGLFSASVAISTGWQGKVAESGNTTKTQGVSIIQSVTLSNGVGYFYTNTPLHIDATVTQESPDNMNVQSCWEVVPFRIFSGP